MLDFFRRGEVARDIKLLAAQGAIAPRPMEQLGILMVLTGDADTEIRETAEKTLAMLPADLVAAYMARSDAPTEIREFFIKRGIAPGPVPAPDAAEPLIDTGEAAAELERRHRGREGAYLHAAAQFDDCARKSEVRQQGHA